MKPEKFNDLYNNPLTTKEALNSAFKWLCEICYKENSLKKFLGPQEEMVQDAVKRCHEVAARIPPGSGKGKPYNFFTTSVLGHFCQIAGMEKRRLKVLEQKEGLK